LEQPNIQLALSNGESYEAASSNSEFEEAVFKPISSTYEHSFSAFREMVIFNFGEERWKAQMSKILILMVPRVKNR
jgi:hypothetical protein